MKFPICKRDSARGSVTCCSQPWQRMVYQWFVYHSLIHSSISLHFLSFVFVPWLQPKTCRAFRERYIKDTSCNWHGKQLSLSSAKFRAVGSKPTLFTAKFRWTFVSKRKFDEIALFVQRKIRSKSLKLSFELSHEISKKVRENKKKKKFAHFACVTFAQYCRFM